MVLVRGIRAAKSRNIVRLERGEAVSLVVAMQAIRVLSRDVALVPRFSKLQVRP